MWFLYKFNYIVPNYLNRHLFLPENLLISNSLVTRSYHKPHIPRKKGLVQLETFVYLRRNNMRWWRKYCTGSQSSWDLILNFFCWTSHKYHYTSASSFKMERLISTCLTQRFFWWYPKIKYIQALGKLSVSLSSVI